MGLHLTGSSLTTLNNAFVGRWKASTAYLATDLVLAPDGTIIQRNANGTSRASYDATEQAAWTVKTSGAGGSGGLTDVVATVNTDGALTIGKHNPVDSTSGNRTMTVADAAAAGKMISVSKKDSSANTVTVSIAHLRDGGAGSITLVGQFEALQLVSKADGTWWPVGDHKTKAYLDATYTAKSVSVASCIENEATGYPAPPSAPMVIWRGWDDPRSLPGFRSGIDLWAAGDTPVNPSNMWFTNFSTETIGGAPANWTSRWAAFASTNIADGGGGTKVLQIRKTSGATTMSFLSWDVVPASADMEIVAKIKVNVTLVTATALQIHTAAARAQGTTDGTDTKNYTGVFRNSTTAPTINPNKRVSPSGNTAFPASGIYPAAPGYADLGWNWVRLRIQGTTLSVRAWADGATEPSTWAYSQVDSSITGNGLAGLATYSSGTTASYDVAAIGVAIGGATAPVAP